MSSLAESLPDPRSVRDPGDLLQPTRRASQARVDPWERVVREELRRARRDTVGGRRDTRPGTRRLPSA